MSKKYIDIMDTTFRDGFQSVFGGRVLMNDFFPAVAAAKEAGVCCSCQKSEWQIGSCLRTGGRHRF